MDLEMKRRGHGRIKDKFQKIFAWDRIEICRFSNEIGSYTSSMITEYLLWVNETYQGIFHKCPYRELTVTNLTLSLDTNDFDTIVPNGEVMLKVHLYNQRDSNIGTMQLTWNQSLINA